MKYLLTALFLNYGVTLFAQKPALDTSSVLAWPYIDEVKISNDGDYLSYCIRVEGKPPLLVVQSTCDSSKVEIRGGDEVMFTDDSKRLIGRNTGDSLGIVDLCTGKVVFTPGVVSYRLPREGNGRWLGYKRANGEFILADLFSGASESYGQVKDYFFGDKGKTLVIQRLEDSLSKATLLEWVDLSQGCKKIIYRGERLSNVSLSEQEDRLAFFESQGEGETARQALCWYNAGEDSARVMVGDGTPGMEAGFQVMPGNVEFSPDGQKVFFNLRHVLPPHPPLRIGAGVDVWNYKDRFLPFQREGDRLDVFKAVYHVRTGKVVRLQIETDGFFGIALVNKGGNGDYLLTATNYNMKERSFADSNRSTLFLVNTENGARTVIVKDVFFPGFAEFSPGGRYVFWYDELTKAYLAYDIQGKVLRNISSRIPVSLCDERAGYAGPIYPYGWAVWLPSDSGLLVYDHYDIWKIDPQGIAPPVDITGGFGRRNRIVLRCSFERDQVHGGKAVITDAKGAFILCALDEKNKFNGFFSLNWRHNNPPEEICMEPALYYFSGSSSVAGFPIEIRKARDTQRYLLPKMSITEYPNWVVTEDFRRFKAITDLEPQRNYNWMRGELVRWKTFSDHTGEGVLYKPEDFDSTRKYPVILYYYERMSDGLNDYLYPDLCYGSMNIPWFVSRGYMVFCPDIYYIPGDPGEGVFDYVVSAAKMLARKPWVDAGHMGIQGHSFGGFETNYLVTRTKIFAAAASSEGVSDMISQDGEAGLGLCAGEGFVEFGIYRMAVPFWQNVGAYIRNSAVFQVQKIGTPLLMMQNKGDGVVPWEQGVELFTALRRLGKPVWMLQYDGEDHNIGQTKNAEDYTIRLTQYFDHYLKGLPEPLWMSVGVSPQWKGVEDGLGY